MSLRLVSPPAGLPCCNQTPAFVLFDALQVDKRTAEGGGGEVRVGDACRGRGKEGASQIFGYSCLQAVR